MAQLSLVTQCYRSDLPSSTAPPAHLENERRREHAVRDLFQNPWRPDQKECENEPIDLAQTS